MSASTFQERLPDFRNQYARLKSKAAKGRFATRLCETFGFERKYLLKLLNGIRRYKPPRGRAATYGPEVERAALRLRRAAGWPCAPYFKEMLPKILCGLVGVVLHEIAHKDVRVDACHRSPPFPIAASISSSVTAFPESSDEVQGNDGTKQPEESGKETSASAGETSAPESASDADTEISDTTVPRNGSDDPDNGDYPETDTGTDAQSTTVPAGDSTGHGIELPVIPLR